jgi:signal transduction histidine kinase
MNKPSDSYNWEELRKEIIGLGSASQKKSFYPALRKSHSDLDRFKAIVDNIPDIILIMSADYVIIDCNEPARESLQFDLNRNHGIPLQEILPNCYTELVKNKTKFYVFYSNKCQCTREATLHHIHAKNQDFKVILLKDISNRITIEQQLQDLNATLEEKVDIRTREIQNKMDELQEAQNQLILSEKMSALGQMVSGLSHEVNTPLGIGVTAVSFMKEKIKSLDNLFQANELRKSDLEKTIHALKETADVLSSNLNRAAHLMNSFKQVSVDQTVFDTRIINLYEYSNQVITSLSPKVKNFCVELDGERDIEFLTIPGAWSQIITNLITNSVDHGFQNGSSGQYIHIELQRRENTVIFDYNDNGRGLSEEEQQKIFEPFFTSNRAAGNTGLGMHLIFNMIQNQLHGTINHFIPENGGTGFRISIPMDHFVKKE